ncbi:MAG: HSP20 family small heat-shock protein [Mycobacterium sp.]|uniref:Hsp20/alpha crystallin family protein n=1 Tax=Mycobacterium sp. TaxID=1785 RepID=UPI002639E314|nr:HSP20 family small heat-shock protein [Mycobacterium sp.]MDI3314234.1 HSP20 family small heat-shock protein [Mycobacterium sp.]
MITMLSFDPFLRDFDRLTQQLLGATLGTAARPAVMPMDARRDGDAVVVEFDLPGIKAESLDVKVENETLTVRAERPYPGDDQGWLVSERPHGVFSRQLYLGNNLDTDKITADYTDGVLRLTIPVAEAAKPRKIPIGAGAPKAIDA